MTAFLSGGASVVSEQAASITQTAADATLLNLLGMHHS
jgi:hypothetical protein